LRRKPKASGLNIFERLDTPFRARRAIEAGQLAGWLLAILNISFAADLAFVRGQMTASALLTPTELALKNLIFAVAFGAAALSIRRGVFPAAAILFGVIAENVFWTTGYIVPIRPLIDVQAISVLLAVSGLRGVFTMRRLTRVADEAPNDSHPRPCAGD
jgi:hypothetical protein